MKHIIVKYPSEMEEEMNNVDFLTFLNYSRIDNQPVYEVKIPENFTEINFIER